MTALDGAVVAVTGAGSGIGRALSLDLAGRGALLAISDRDPAGLAQTAALVTEAHPRARPYSAEVDVADSGVVSDWAATVMDRFGRVNVVVNNAGVAFSGDVADSTLADLAWVMGINFWGVVHGTTAFLPHLAASGAGHLVNLSSLFGLIAVPSQSQYVAAKFAVRGWSEALREELLLARSPVQVSCVHPGGIRTGIARNARAAAGYDQAALARFFDTKLAAMSAERAAEIILRGVERNRPRILVGRDALALDVLQRVLGARYQRVVVAAARRSGAMDHRRVRR